MLEKLRKVAAATVLSMASVGAANVVIAAQTNLVQNGDFSTGDLTNWTKIGSEGLVVTNTTNTKFFFATGCSGHDCVSTAGSGSAIQQLVSDTSGQSYQLTLALAENTDVGPSEFSIFWHGNMIADITDPALGTVTYVPTPPFTVLTYSLTPFTFTVTGTGSDSLEIHGRNDPGGIYFTDISVSAVPEPSESAMLAVGLVGIFGIGLVRRNSGR